MSAKQSLLAAAAIVFALGCSECDSQVHTIRLGERVHEVRVDTGCNDKTIEAVDYVEEGAENVCPGDWVITALTTERHGCGNQPTGLSAAVECKTK